MMKNKKALLWIGLALFVVPEVLWSPVGNMLYSILTPSVNGSVQVLRDTFVVQSENVDWLSFLLLMQTLGVALVVIAGIASEPKRKALASIASIIFFVVFLLTILSYSIRSVG